MNLPNEIITIGDYFYTNEGSVIRIKHISPKGTKCTMMPPVEGFGWAISTDVVRKMQKLTPEEVTMYLLKR